jgi:hypothetical protein
VPTEPWHYPPDDPRSGLPQRERAEETAVPASTPVSFSQARGRGALGWLKGKLAQVQRLGEAAERLDLEQLAEQGLGMLLDDVVGPVVTDAAAPSAPSATRSAARACIALDHEHMPAHRARLPGCVEGPA